MLGLLSPEFCFAVCGQDVRCIPPSCPSAGRSGGAGAHLHQLVFLFLCKRSAELFCI